MKGKPLTFAIVGSVLVLAGCMTSQARDVSLSRQTGIRVDDVTFDAHFTREQYVLLGDITGTGQIDKRQAGNKGNDRSYFHLLGPFFYEFEASLGTWVKGWVIGPKSYRAYEVYDYDPSLGTWADEGMVSLGAISDRKMLPAEAASLRTMETIAARIALSNALKSMPEADAVLAPRYEFSYKLKERLGGEDLVVSRDVLAVTAVLRGKAVRIKTDQELYDTYQRFPFLLDSKARAEQP